MLSKLGFSFDADELDVFTASAYSIISNEYAKLEEQESKRAARKK